MMTARSAEEPVTTSVTVSMMGWVILNVAPGMTSGMVRERSVMRSALVRPAGHWS